MAKDYRYPRWLLVIVPAVVFIYFSYQPVTELRSEMPAQFVDVRPNAGAAERAAEERIAQAYWDLARSDIQWKYAHGVALPDSPPERFRISLSEPPGPEVLAASRLPYWRRLQRVWLQPSSWVTARTWSVDWLTSPVISVIEWIRSFFKSKTL